MTQQMTGAGKSRIEWVDIGKGICILLVVMMHATFGVERVLGETSWLNGFIAWARPFRMPDFFLISGLFLASRINRPWRAYLDTKVVHFAYFYVLWMTILLCLKGVVLPEGLYLSDYLLAFVDPHGSLWFIYMLAVFFIVVKLLRDLPWWLVFGAGVLLHSLSIHTGWTLVDEFAARFVYFHAGYLFAPQVFRFADRVSQANGAALFNALVLWAVVNGWAVASGAAVLPGLSLLLGFAGAAAVISIAVILTKTNWAGILRYFGENSIVIYLAYALFMGFTRIITISLCEACDAGFVSLVVTAVAVAGPLVLHWAVRKTPLAFLFVRPNWARISHQRKLPGTPKPLVSL